MVGVARCPYCFTDLGAIEPVVRCARCGTPHHRACFVEHGKCVILYCASVRSLTADGVELLAKKRLTVQVGPARVPFHIRGGYIYGDPEWLDVVAQAPEVGRHRPNEIEIGLAVPHFAPGEEVVGQVSLHLESALQARAVRFVLRTTRTTPGSVVPKTLLEREAVLVGKPWEGHLRALGLAVKRVLHMEGEDELIRLTAGVTRWQFRFRLDPLHPVRLEEGLESVLSELIAYVDVPAGADVVGRLSLPIVRSKT